MILYHVTKDNNIDIFNPSISSKTMPSEDRTTPRISASDTIDGCFRGLNIDIDEIKKIRKPVRYCVYQVIYRPRTSIKSDKELSIMVKEIIKAIPKSEHHLFYNKSEYTDSPYTKYRDAVYIGNDGAFIDIYSIDDDTIGNVVIVASPEARGTGVTDNLIQRAIVACKEFGMHELQWRCSRYNIHSMKTAERNYFVMDRKESTKKEVVYKYKLI